MAYHDDERGYTPIIVGRYYKYTSTYPFLYKLIKVNKTTEYCTLRSYHSVMFISETQLSNWYMMPGICYYE